MTHRHSSIIQDTTSPIRLSPRTSTEAEPAPFAARPVLRSLRRLSGLDLRLGGTLRHLERREPFAERQQLLQSGGAVEVLWKKAACTSERTGTCIINCGITIILYI